MNMNKHKSIFLNLLHKILLKYFLDYFRYKVSLLNFTILKLR